jgi:hypothetical protein
MANRKPFFPATSARNSRSVRNRREEKPDSKAIEIRAGAYALVVAIDPALNQLTVEKANQEFASYDLRRLTGVSVYQEIDREFSVGDRVQFTAPDKSLGVAKRDLAMIEAIHPDGRLSARLDNNRQIEFSATALR